MAKLSTHVLDTSRGKPAEGVQIRLFQEGKLVASAATNQDGRTAEPLLSGDTIPPGTYELEFAVGAYFGSSEFLDDVVVRFRIADPVGNYHVPLLISPFGYTMYRGS